MKRLCFLACFILTFPAPQMLLILDKELKKPLRTATEFSAVHYMKHDFPVYAADVAGIIRATDSAVKRLDKKNVCHSSDTIMAAHTMFILSTDCEDEMKLLSVLVITKIDESKNSFCFTIATKEHNKRKIQQKLLDFSTYLSQ